MANPPLVGTVTAKLSRVRAANAESEPINRLYSGSIARKNLTLMVGDPGAAKPVLLSDLAARITRGRIWPGLPGNKPEPADTKVIRPPASVLLCNNEDGIGDAIRPSGENADADLAKLYIINGTDEETSATLNGSIESRTVSRVFDISLDLPVLRERIIELKDVALVIFDPLSEHLSGIDLNQTNDVRAALAPLIKLAEECNVAVNKDAQKGLIYRTSGSIAFSAIARMIYLLCKHPTDYAVTGAICCLSVKNNLAKVTGGFTFRVLG
jgi:AAA domain